MTRTITEPSRTPFIYHPNIRARKGGFSFESNPGLIMWEHRLPELLKYAAKEDIDSIKVTLSDAFQREVYRNEWDLYTVILNAKAILATIKKHTKHKNNGNSVPCVAEDDVIMDAKANGKYIITPLHSTEVDHDIYDLFDEQTPEVAEFYDAVRDYDEAS